MFTPLNIYCMPCLAASCARSRGRERRFLRAMEEKGFPEDRVVRVAIEIADFNDLRGRFLDMTAAMPDKRTRSKDRFYPELV